MTRDEDYGNSLRATLAFAGLSGAWIVEGEPAPEPEAPADLPIFSQPLGGELAAIREELGDCKRCRLHLGRTHIVFGVGSETARIMFVGEGPGEEEDKRGEPFVGRAGLLLDKMIRAMGMGREEVYIANTVKCRPPKNRDPAEDEKAACMEFLKQQIEAVNPAVIVALGGHAAKSLTGSEAPISRLRGKVHDYQGRKLVATFHPAYLLRNPEAKKHAWTDLKLVLAEAAQK